LVHLDRRFVSLSGRRRTVRETRRLVQHSWIGRQSSVMALDEFFSQFS